MSHASPVAEATYFDLHTQGLGYLNRIREVTPSPARRFWPAPSPHSTARLRHPSTVTSM